MAEIPVGEWTRTAIMRIEDLGDAVHGAGLKATQMSRDAVTGSLAFAQRDQVIYSSGHINGRVLLTGPLSESMVSLGVGLTLAPGTQHWLHEVSTGNLGLFMPGDEHEALYCPGSLYVCVTLPEDHAEELGAHFGRVLKVRQLGGSGVDSRPLNPIALNALRCGFESIHRGGIGPAALQEALLQSLIEHFGRWPRPQIGPAEYRGYSRIVRRGREYIEQNLQAHLSIQSVAAAAQTSCRTLFRAFTEILGESPVEHVRRLRLHQIRHDLLHDPNPANTVTRIATRWGVTELGRFSGWYRDVFGEMPSQTRGRAIDPVWRIRSHARLAQSA